MARKKQYPGSNSIGAMTPDGWHTRSDAARLVGRDPDTLKMWHRKAMAGNDLYNEVSPSGKMKAGLLDVWLYSDEDIESMKRFVAARKGVVGKPSKQVS